MSKQDYMDMIRRACFNIHTNALLDNAVDVVHETDSVLARGTLLERIEHDTNARRTRFHNMLQEKYESLNDRTYEAIVRCRRCGSSDVSWEEKQVRSADEAASLFCVCNKCKTRWVTS